MKKERRERFIDVKVNGKVTPQERTWNEDEESMTGLL